MELTYRYRLYPNAKQLKRIVNTCSCTRFLYNKLLQIRTEHFRETGLWCELDMEPLVQGNGFLQNVDQSALSWSLKHLEQAYKQFFHRKPKIKERIRPETQYKLVKDPTYQINETDLAEYPRYKRKKGLKHQSYTTSASIARIDHDRVFLPYIGFVKMKMHRPLPEEMDEILRFTVVVKRSGQVYLLVQFRMADVPKRHDLCRPLGIVFEPALLAVRSDGVPVAFEHADPKLQKKIQKLKKEIKRSVRGSKACTERERKLAALYEKQKNQRWDSLHKSARQIANADNVDAVYMETPAVKKWKQQLMAVRGVPELIRDEAWWGFSELLRYKLKQQGKHFWRVDPTFPIRGICSHCNGRAAESLPWQDKWVCPHCGSILSSEQNAARNLQAMAESFIQSHSVGPN